MFVSSRPLCKIGAPAGFILAGAFCLFVSCGRGHGLEPHPEPELQNDEDNDTSQGGDSSSAPPNSSEDSDSGYSSPSCFSSLFGASGVGGLVACVGLKEATEVMIRRGADAQESVGAIVADDGSLSALVPDADADEDWSLFYGTGGTPGQPILFSSATSAVLQAQQELVEALQNGEGQVWQYDAAMGRAVLTWSPQGLPPGYRVVLAHGSTSRAAVGVVHASAPLTVSIVAEPGETIYVFSVPSEGDGAAEAYAAQVPADETNLP